MQAASRLDHGELNVPLAKRGNIDAQIDRYKAEQAREARQQQAAITAARREARALVARLSDERLAELGKPHGLTVIQTRAQFVSMSVSHPRAVVSALSKELA